MLPLVMFDLYQEDLPFLSYYHFSEFEKLCHIFVRFVLKISNISSMTNSEVLDLSSFYTETNTPPEIIEQHPVLVEYGTL